MEPKEYNVNDRVRLTMPKASIILKETGKIPGCGTVQRMGDFGMVYVKFDEKPYDIVPIPSNSLVPLDEDFMYDEAHLNNFNPEDTVSNHMPKSSKKQQRYVVYVELNDGTTKIIERCPDKKKAMDFVKKFKTKEIDKIVYKLKYRKEN